MNNSNIKNIDILGIGIGPFNLGLAALISHHPEIKAVFLEKKPQFRWHEGLLLEGTTLQIPFFADLVTIANPCHPLSYINYLHQHDRLHQFYYYDRFLIPRREYDHYCRWASEQLPDCHFAEKVCDVIYDTSQDKFMIESESNSGQRQTYQTQDLVVGIGTQPHYPKWLSACDHPLVKHSAEFSYVQKQLNQCKQVTVVGSGQSAAECVLALYRALSPEQIEAGASIRWITRSAGFHPMEFSKLGQECFTPAYMQYFQSIPREKRREIAADQGLIYKGISFSTIGEIYDALYEKTVAGGNAGLSLYSSCDVKDLEISSSGSINLRCWHTQLEQHQTIQTYAVIAATGYRHQWPHWFEKLKNTVLKTDQYNDCLVQEDFTAERCDQGKGRIFIQNAEIFQQGVGSPDLGIGATRNSIIINQLLEREAYRIPKRSAFQHYGLAE